MTVKIYKGEPRYILETNYGCHSNYGWTFTTASDELESARIKLAQWRNSPGRYRLIDNSTSRVIM